jgi:hypothetical protein
MLLLLLLLRLQPLLKHLLLQKLLTVDLFLARQLLLKTNSSLTF